MCSVCRSDSESASDSSGESVSSALLSSLQLPSSSLELLAAGAALLVYSPEEEMEDHLPSPHGMRVHQVENAFAASWLHGRVWVVGVRGTEVSDWRDLEDDADVQSEPVYWASVEEERGCRAHRGFCRHFSKLQASLLHGLLQAPWMEVDVVLFCGHSLGGAVAYLAGFFFSEVLRVAGFSGRVCVRTFGSPKVGDGSFRRWCESKSDIVDVRSYVNSRDLVPTVPLELARNWSSQERVFKSSTTPLQAHSMRGYFEDVLHMEGRRG